MKDMTVVANILTYPHHLEEPQKFTTSAVKNMHPLIQTQSHHTAEVLQNCPADQYAGCLTFSSSKEYDDNTPMDETPSPHSTLPVQHHMDTFQQSPSRCTLHTYVTLEAEEEDMEDGFQTVPLDDEHWDMEEIPDRTLCIHKHAIPHGLCPYPCPYANSQASS